MRARGILLPRRWLCAAGEQKFSTNLSLESPSAFSKLLRSVSLDIGEQQRCRRFTIRINTVIQDVNPAFSPDQFCSSAALDRTVVHTVDVLSPFIPALCHSDSSTESPVHVLMLSIQAVCAWPSSPACTWHCSLHGLFVQPTPLFPHGVTTVS